MSSLIQANVTIQGSITSLGTFGQTTYAPVDLGVNSLSLKTGNLTSLVTTTSSAPTGFAAAGEGALVFPGTANAYISFGTSGVPFSNSNIYAFGDFVVEAWVNPSVITGQIVVVYGDPVSGSNYWSLILSATGAINWTSFLNGTPSQLTTNGTLSVGTWQHVTVIHQSSTKRVQVYINGQPQTFSTPSGGWTVSGTIASYTTGIIPVSGQQIVIGQSAPTNTLNGSLTNLRITTGSGAAQIYNNNAFTPSTTPLFPASNTAGGSLTTRLLVRVPLATNKMVVPKLGGQNCNTVLAFPPAPMTGYATNMTGQSYYGQGVYVASDSSNSGYPAWHLFDKNTSTFWQVGSSYTANTPYSGTTRTVDVSGNSYAGEWAQIQLPVSIVLSSYMIYEGGGAMPTAWYILGSRDGTNWYLVDQRNTSVWTGYTTFNASGSQAYMYYRFVYNTSSGVSASLYEIIYNGTIEGPSISADGRLGLGVSNPVQALEVAGNAVIHGSLAVASGTVAARAVASSSVSGAYSRTVTVSGGSYGGTLEVTISAVGSAGGGWGIYKVIFYGNLNLANFGQSGAYTLIPATTSFATIFTVGTLGNSTAGVYTIPLSGNTPGVWQIWATVTTNGNTPATITIT